MILINRSVLTVVVGFLSCLIFVVDDVAQASQGQQPRVALQASPALEQQEKTLELARSDGRVLQAGLRRLGYLTFEVDGVFGEASRQALANWQQDQGLKVTGYFTAGDLERLRRAINRQQQLLAMERKAPKEFWRKATPVQVADLVAMNLTLATEPTNIMTGNDNDDFPTRIFLAATYNENPDVTALLLDRGVDVNAPNVMGDTPLLNAIATNENPEVAILLVDRGVDVNAIGEFTSPLSAAVRRSTTEIAAMLLDRGADVNAQDYTGSPLFVAASNENPELAALLLDRGADVNAIGHFGLTPLHFAASNENPEVAALLLDRGADIEATDVENGTPLYIAARDNKNPRVLALLLDRGADVASSRGSHTLLHEAAGSNENPEVLAMLLDRGADVNAVNDQGTTPLHLAVWYNKNPQVVALLLERGADPKAKNKSGRTPLGYAPKAGNPEIRALLLQHAAKK